MLTWIAASAHRLDGWLQERFGRPYNALLGVGLVVEIIRRLQEAPRAFSSAGGGAGAIFALVVAAALLLHQVGALSPRLERRRREKAEAGAEPSPD